jgi:hypothetical protein
VKQGGITVQSAPELSPRDRLLGYQTLRLIGNWETWVHRRVESIQYESASSIRRRVSVDLRLREELFGDPVFRWADESIQYVPIALLNKQALIRFDVHDEEGRALPVMSRHRNARITAATLVALAQSLISSQLRIHGSDAARVPANRLAVPVSLEADFWRLAFFNPTYRGDEEDAAAIYSGLLGAPAEELEPLNEWEWSESGGQYEANVSEGLWRWALFRDAEFARFANDVSRLFVISVPLLHEPNRRRIVKFSYTQHVLTPESDVGTRAKEWAAQRNLAKRWNDAEDWLEGLPRVDPARDEWVPQDVTAATTDHESVSLSAKLRRWLGWAATPVPFDTPAIGHGASYHLDVLAPPGIQVRRAQLVLERPHVGRQECPAQRGTQTLRTAHLYATRVGQNTSASALVHFRPESGFIARAATLAALLSAVALTLLYVFGDRIARGHAEAAAAVLVVIPGLIAAYSARAEEHPLATTMAFGLRLMAVAPGVLAAFGAALVVVEEAKSPAGLATFVAAWVVAGILGVSWRLAGRGRPHAGAFET